MKLRCPYCKHELPDAAATCPQCRKTMVVPGRVHRLSMRERKKARDRIRRDYKRGMRDAESGPQNLRIGSRPLGIGVMLLVLLIVGGLLIQKAKRAAPAGSVARSPETITRKELRNLYIAIERFKLDCGRYPTTEEGLQALILDPGLFEWRRPYVTLIRPDPWGRPYLYRCDSSNAFTLVSSGPDRRMGTPDDLVPEKPALHEISLKLASPPEEAAANAPPEEGGSRAAPGDDARPEPAATAPAVPVPPPGPAAAPAAQPRRAP